MPRKISAFCSLALKDACLPQDSLKRRKFHQPNRCYMCLNSSESVNHLFLHCPVASEIWSMYLSLFGLQWVIPSSIREIIVRWNFWLFDKSFKRIWSKVPTTILWCLWIGESKMIITLVFYLKRRFKNYKSTNGRTYNLLKEEV